MAVPGAVAVTGLGVLSAIGHGVAAFSQGLRAGRCGIARLPAPEGSPPLAMDLCGVLGGLDSSTIVARHPGAPAALLQAVQQAGRRAPFTVQATLDAALQAFVQAGLHTCAPEPDRIGLVVAGNNTTRRTDQALAASFGRAPEFLSPRYALQSQDTDQLGVLSTALGLRGEACTVGGASASGKLALVQALRLLRSGAAEACLVVGVPADLTPLEIQGYRTIGALGGKRFRDDPQRACRPFDAAHEGFIPGQAAACLVLETVASATRRGVPVLARLAGGAVRLHGTAGAEPSIDGEARAMRAALQDAGLEAAAIGCVNTHGSSSPLGDRTEVAAIEMVFGAHFGSAWLNATKGLTGHGLGAAGVLEAVACVLQLREGFLHPNLNLEDPIHPQARFCGPRFEDVQVDAILSNSFGFGGINSSIVLQAAAP